ncbi:unnamed protein product, partial [Choristocarpus tenellus]
AESKEGRQSEVLDYVCIRCGKKGWSIPSGGWKIVPFPVGLPKWTTETLLEEVDFFVKQMYENRLEPHRCIWNGMDGPSGSGKKLSSVPCYGFVEQLDPHRIVPFLRRAGLTNVLELKYAFLYGYNGTTFVVPGTRMGTHTGDLEHVTVRVDAHRLRILEVFFAAHGTGEGKWVPSEWFFNEVLSLETDPSAKTLRREDFLHLSKGEHSNPFQDCQGVEGAITADGKAEEGFGDGGGGGGNRPLVFPARNGHASYPAPQRLER